MRNSLRVKLQWSSVQILRFAAQAHHLLGISAECQWFYGLNATPRRRRREWSRSMFP